MRREWYPALVGRVVWVVFGLLVVPVLAGLIDGRLWIPLALPGYLLMLAITFVASVLVPQYRLWVFWPVFVLASYAISVVVAGAYYALTGGPGDWWGR